MDYVGEFAVTVPPELKGIRKLKHLIEEAKLIIEEEGYDPEETFCVVPGKGGTIHVFVGE